MVKSRQKMNKSKNAQKGAKEISRKEMTRLGGALRALGGLAGGAAGSLIGMSGSGASMGTGLGAALSRWLGSGDYSVGANSIVQRSLKGSDSIPAMHSNNQSVVIRHKEYIGEIRGNQTFTVNDSFQINPGNQRTFPWLSGVASRFQEYRIKGMVYHYIPSSGTAVSSTDAALGTVMMVTSYRATDSAPTSKVELLNEYWASESVPSDSFCHPIECDPKENPYNVQYVRTGEVPAGDSRMLYDLGVTYVATSGQQISGKVLGDLWVTYEIELKKPIVASNVTDVVHSFAQSFVSAGTSSLTTNIFPGTGSAIWGGMAVTLSNRKITFPKGALGFFLVTMRYYAGGSYTITTGFTVPTYTNCAASLNAPGGTSLEIFNDADDILVEIGVLITDPAVEASVEFPAVNIAYTNSSTVYVTVNPFTV